MRSPGTPDDLSAPVNRVSHSAKSTAAISAMTASSVSRSIGIVVTGTAPAFSTPNQHATSHGVFGPRSRTRLPGTIPWSSASTLAIRFEVRRSSP